MSYSVPPSIYNIVHPIASDDGVPDSIWEDVVYVESGFNPNAYNPSGAYGLFQLLYPGGQGDAAIKAGYSVQDLYKPNINAAYGMPSVSQAWKDLGGSFDPNSLSWWEKFAAESGHPGGAPGQVYTDQVAQTLMNDYQAGDTSGQNPIQQTVSNIQNGVSFLSNLSVENVQHALIKTGVFFVALTVIIIGFVILVKS